MTIAVGVACPEGLVLSADSRMSVIGENYFRVTDHAHKVFEVAGRFAVVTFGWATIEGNTIAGVMEEFAAQTRLRKDVDEAAEKLRDYFRARLERHIQAGFDEPPAEGVDVLGFIVGGYDETGVGRLKLVYLPSGEIVVGGATSANETGAHWQGDSDVFVRLLKGYDAIRLDTAAWPEEYRDALAGLEYLAPFSRMGLQDAIDFASFVIRTTIDMQRFSDGTVGDPGSYPTCGGAIETLTVTARGPEWVARRALRQATSPGSAEGSLG